MKFLLITGAYRSGTSYLQKVFDYNSKCDVLFQPAIKYFKLIDSKIRTDLKKRSFKNFPLGITKINRNIILKNIILSKKKILNLTSKLIRSEKKHLYFYKNIYKRIKLEENTINSEQFLKILFYSIQKTDKKKIVIGVKEPYLGNLLIPLSNLENIHIINIIRDPREIIYSRNYAQIKNHSNFQNKKHPVIFSSLLCLRNMEADLKLRNKKNYFSLKFKDLINKKKKIEKKLSEFLKIRISLDLRNRWKINSSGSNTNYGSNWKKNMKIEDIAIIEKICSDKFDYYGFEKEIKNKSTLNHLIKKFKEDKRNILKWTNKPLFIRYDFKRINKI